MVEHVLVLEPVKGRTLARQTRTEYLTDQTFKIMDTSYPKYRRGEWVTRYELEKDTQYHGVSFDLRFNIQTPFEYADQQANA